MTVRRNPRASHVLPMARKVPAPLRGMRPDLATLARQLEDEVNLLWESTGVQETTGRELEHDFTELKIHVADVARGARE